MMSPVFSACFLRPVVFAALALSAAPLTAQVVISEFMASNATTRADEDGDFSDWIELHNTTSAPVNLDNWSLTDQAANPGRWRLPEVTLGPKAYLIVWASNKNRRTPGSQLHTNFRLDGAGEYLALVRPDGTKATEFAPAYPPQVEDRSYGFAAQSTLTNLLQAGSAGRVLVPTDGSLGETWTQPGFDDSAWVPAVNGIGFETGANEYGPGWIGEVLADGPTAFYRLEETGVLGIAAANAGSLGAAGTGSYIGGVTQNVVSVQRPAFPGWEATNSGARFDGTNDRVDMAYQPAFNGTSFSFSLWMRWNGGNASTHKAALTSRESTPQRGYICYVLPTTQQLSFWTGASTSWDTLDAPAALGTIAANTWYHVAGTFDGATNTKTLYLNGVPVATKTSLPLAVNTQFPLRIGAGNTEGSGAFWFPGDIDEVQVYGRALTAAEVQAQHAAATGAGGTGTEAAAAITAQAPVGWWRLTDATTVPTLTAANLGTAGAAANGTYLGAGTPGAPGPQPPSEAGLPAGNRAFRMAGAGYIETPYQAELNPSVFTVECWARATGGAGTFRAPVSGRNDTGSQTQGYILYAASNNTWQFWTGSGGSGAWDPITGPAVVLNQWVHLVGTFDGTTKRFYVNGTQAGTGASAVFNPNTVRGLRIGAGQNEAAPGFFFQGDVDEVAIHSRALTAQEVSARYALGKNNTAPPPLNDFAGLIGTDLRSRMLGVNATAYYRLPFTLTDLNEVDALLLKMKYDDGFSAWLNGVPVAEANVPESGLTWNAAAAERSANSDAVEFESFNLGSNLGALRQGVNVLAIQGLNLAASNPDFLQLAQLEAQNVGNTAAVPSWLQVPSPGGPNTGGTTVPGPSISQESHMPALPAATDDLVVTVRVQPVFAPVATVNLKWRTAFNAEQTTVMRDDGTGGDAVAGDFVHTATIPRTSYVQGQIVRWFFEAADAEGRTSRWPLFGDPLNSPQYFGTMIAPTGFTTQLPVWHWFAQNTSAAATRAGTRGVVFYNGRLYDNIFIRLRGGATSTGSKKFDFNTGHHCFIDDVIGRVEEANLNGSGQTTADTIIRPSVAFELMRRSGHPALAAFPVMMRVNGALDTGSGRGGVAYFVEQPDERYLDRIGFDRDGALYKMNQRSNLEPVFSDSTNGVQKRTRTDEPNTDLQELVDAVHSTTPDDWAYSTTPVPPAFPAGFTATRTTKLFDLLNMPNVVNYLAARVIIADTDDTRKNFYLYRDTEGDLEWRILAWDKDGTLGNTLDAAPFVGHPFQGDYARRKVNSFHQWNYLYEACFNEPKIRDMMLRRLRTLMDTVLGSAAGAPEALADALWAPIVGTTPVIGTYNGQTNASIKNFFSIRRNGPASTSTSSGLFSIYSAANALGTGVRIPDAQPAAATLAFGDVDYLPASGDQDHEFVQLTNPNGYAVDVSGWELRGGVEFTFEPGTIVRAGDSVHVAARKRGFRSRTTGPRAGQQLLIVGGYAGTISARGEVLELWDPRTPGNAADDRLVASLTTPATPTPAQQQLRITELMYDPPPGGAFAAGEYEYLELMNIGATPLDLTGAAFTSGITFTFPTLTLAAGARVVVVKNAAAFAARYGGAATVAGSYTGSLDNSGERIRLADAMGEEVLDFTYDGTWLPNTHGDAAIGGGASMVIIDPLAPWTAWDARTSWRASSGAPQPGAPDPAPAAASAASWSGGNTLTARGEPGRTYRLQRTTDLGAWTDAGWFTAGADGTITAADPAPPPGRAYYRLATH